jgi:hypothetical protein
MNKVAVYGGLGNQMFQYAFCVALNEKGKKTRPSFSGFLYDHHHNGFNLSRAFKLKLPFPASVLNFFLAHGKLFYKNRFSAFVSRKLTGAYHKKYSVYKEKKEFAYDPEVFEQRSGFFVGVWQVESYFKDIKKKILDTFVFNVPVDTVNTALIDKIKNSNSVSVHIRRGDYLDAKWKESLVVIKDNTYYERALEYMNEKIEEPHYFVFSDDIKWVQQNIKIPNVTYVDHNTGTGSYIDMYLMSLCKHNIIANSSFSWWGAWLNKNEHKVVLMPEKWFNRDYCEGIFPKEWIKIKL